MLENAHKVKDTVLGPEVIHEFVSPLLLCC